ncbi:MAG: galactokinase [Anaerolinea sp.]|nr:galactokinase [Anaerolinea sp.]
MTSTDWLETAPLHVRSPGRVNLLGEHVDYNQGVVLPAAIDRQVDLFAWPMDERHIEITALDLNETVKFTFTDLGRKLDQQQKPLPTWALYPAGIAWAAQQHDLRLHGFKAAFRSDIPIAAGLSSSAAVEVAFALLSDSLGGWALPRLDLARLCQQAENEYVGVHSGLMDQFACAFGVPGSVLRFDTRSLECRALPLPPGAELVIADTGLRRSLANSAYNDRRKDCEQAVAELNRAIPGLQSLRDLSLEDFYRLQNTLPERSALRARHVVEEMARVEAATDCLVNNDASGLGKLMYAGHVSLRDQYQVSLPEIDALVEIARGLPGCYGARLTGAGFGGCTVNLVQTHHVRGFIAALQSDYHAKTGREAQVFACKASAGASILKKN